MRVTIVGAGVLGRVYGVRLATRGEDVTFVVRPERIASAGPFVTEQVNGPKRHDTLASPRLATEIPEDTEVTLVTVRFDQLAEAPPHAAPAAGRAAVVDLLRDGPAAPIAVLTPLLPPQRAALDEAAGRRIVPAMPSVSGYLDERGAVRYWIPGIVTTLIDADAAPAARPLLEDLARRLTNADLPARLEHDVAALNAATTTSFFPLIVAIDAGGGIDGVLSNKVVLDAALEGARECEALAHRLGKLAPWAGLLTRFVGPFTLKPGVVLARRLFPEAVRFVDLHFGPKLHEQHLAMGATILAMGREHGVSMPALERLMALLQARSSAAAR
jgi:2-dehydropantoate 2-reductase